MSNNNDETVFNSTGGTVSSKSPVILHPDGTITRVNEFPSTPASSDPTSSAPVLSKDVPLNPQHNTFVRLYLPRQSPDNSSSTITTKLPIIVYYHGGGFVFCSAATSLIHNFCEDMATQIGAVIVSVEYRLAPEHRLPAAYDDATEALHWIRTSDDEWLRESADFSNCFIMGCSAGGNIAYHVGLRVATTDTVDCVVPLKIKGLVLHQPYFGGSECTPSELRYVNDIYLPLSTNHLCWDLSLPIGANRDHEYCNMRSTAERLGSLRCKVMVTGSERDPLIDRQMELVKGLEMKGVSVISWFPRGGYHGYVMMDPTQVQAFLPLLKSFVYSP